MAESEVARDDAVVELARKAAEVEVLRHASLDINSTLDLEEIYAIALRTMAELFEFHHSVILLLDETENVLQVVASRGFDDQALGGTVPVGTGVIGMVAKRRSLMRVANLKQQRTYSAAIRQQMEVAGRAAELAEVVPVPGLPDAESQIAIPLMVQDTLIGVFSVETPEHKRFSEHDEVLVTIVSNQVASAMRNAQLFGTVEQRRKELAEAHEGLRKLNDTLEDRVRERTQALERSNQELREAQAQLVQSEKMASLGNLAAGVAHEINTPIGAIRSNADVQRRAIKIVRESGNHDEEAQDSGEHPRVHLALEVLEDTNRVTQEATDRVTTIVDSLRNFARLDEAEYQAIDLHEGIDSSLTLIRHLLTERVKVVKHYGSLPEVQCFASQLNQVFMNLLTNAVQAIEDEGTITISTEYAAQYAVVRISDTGCGIEADKLAHIFDPGFTLKGVGVGVGLGLSIVYRIVQDHLGTIEVESEPGVGTTFTLKLPLEPSAKAE